MAKDLDYKIKKMELGPLQRFKNQNAVLKKFGEDGLKVYRAADGKSALQAIADSLGLEADFVLGVAQWLEEKKMAKRVGGEVAEAPEEEKPEEEEKAVEAKEEKAEIPEAVALPRRSRIREIIEKEQKPSEEEEKKEEEQIPEQEEIKPVTGEEAPEEEKPEEEVPEEGKKAEEEEEEKKEEEEQIPEQEEIKPVTGEEAPEEEKPEEEGKGEEEEKAPEEEVPEEGEKITPESEAGPPEEGKPGEEIVPEAGDEDLNPVEKTIKDKYGDAGLKVYALIDGQKTAEEIMNDVGVSEAKLIEMLEFMENQGIIKLEHPEAKAAEEKEEEKESFSPLAEASALGQMKELSPVEVPSKLKMDIMGFIQLKAKTALKYGEKGAKVSDAVNGIASDVDISSRLGVPLYDVKDLLGFLAVSKAVKLRVLERNEIISRYGEDCFTVYKRYGREGVLLYELVGKDLSIKQMARMVTKDKERFADMLIFIHKVLGIDIPIDKDVIFSQLGSERW